MSNKNSIEKVKAIQGILEVTSDGLWGPLSKKALEDLISSKAEPTFSDYPLLNDFIFDKRTTKNLLTLDAKAQKHFKPFIVRAQDVARSQGLSYVGIAGHRTWAEQNELFAQGRTKPGNIVTKARGGQSNHNFGVAMDFGVFDARGYLDDSTPERKKIAEKLHFSVAKFAPEYNLEWGGSWEGMLDYPHFEVKTNLSMREKQTLYFEKGSIL